ncbi:MAG: glycosyltransferase [Xanthobacteraceae bacterium]
MSRPLRLVQQVAQPIEFGCPLCGSVHAAYIFGTGQFRIFRCGGCALSFSKKASRAGDPSVPAQLGAIAEVNRSERDHAGLLAAVGAAAINGPVLLVARPQDSLIALLRQRGLTIGTVVGEDDFGPADWGTECAAAIVSDALMRVPDPRVALAKIREHLAPGAPVLLSVPLLDGSQARIMGRSWHEWQPVNRWYFTRETLNLLLLSAGFEHVWFEIERRSYSLEQVAERMRGNEETASWAGSIERLSRLLPQFLRRREFRLPAGTAVVSAVVGTQRPERVVSIIVPVFNEAKTFKTMMDALLAKSLPDVRKEIIIVESNSSDGSRELVQSYADHSEVRVVLQPRPRGKGHAVREGLAMATGDIVMIQDADLEYDLDDYDGLLAPLNAWQSMFILGSRHQGGWKMRKFEDAPLTAAIFNFGHSFFRTAINLALNTSMTDPFTMFKVFRRDAIFGIDFVCNRFDFDIELVMKLVRKGYVPVELPVNYASRSFAEGKKVSFTRDGLTWLWTIAKMRLSPLGRGPA